MNRWPDWSLWRSFAAVVEDGSLSAAARRLGLSQPTLGRHIDTLEHDLGVPLFERTLQGFKPTDTALRLYHPVSTARAALSEAALMAEGATEALNGTVRITSSAIMCNYILPPFLVALRREFPAIALELVASDSTENLLLREADIAVRMFRPTQLDLITKKLGESPIVACAHKSYLDRAGTPTHLAELAHHDLIGLDRSDLIITAAANMGHKLTRENFATRTDSQTAGWELIKAGLGIGFTQKKLASATPDIVTIFEDLAVPPLEIWLTTHRELFTSRRIRAIYDRLAVGLSAYARS